MRIGVAKEIKPDEYRVALTPAGALELTQKGHEVLVETGAGQGSAMPDGDYLRAGASVVSVDDVWERAELLLKVKEPVEAEYERLREGLVLFTYLHIAADEPLTRALADSGIAAVAYETVETNDRRLPLLAPMSEIAGRLAPQAGAYFLEKPLGGRGLLIGGVPGVQPGRVLVLGGGVVGYNAAVIAIGLGAQVTILDKSIDRMRYLDEILSGRVSTVIVDVAIDQGGCVETARPTTHSDPVYEVDGVIHYCVANMPGGVPVTSTKALTNATLPYVEAIAEHGLKDAIRRDNALALGVNVLEGKITYEPVADAHDLDYTPLGELLPTLAA